MSYRIRKPPGLPAARTSGLSRPLVQRRFEPLRTHGFFPVASLRALVVPAQRVGESGNGGRCAAARQRRVRRECATGSSGNASDRVRRITPETVAPGIGQSRFSPSSDPTVRVGRDPRDLDAILWGYLGKRRANGGENPPCRNARRGRCEVSKVRHNHDPGQRHAYQQREIPKPLPRPVGQDCGWVFSLKHREVPNS